MIRVLNLSAGTVRVISQTKLRKFGSERAMTRQILRDKVIGHDPSVTQTPPDIRKERVGVTTSQSRIPSLLLDVYGFFKRAFF